MFTRKNGGTFSSILKEKLSQSAARTQCQALGTGWDLVILSKSREYDFVVSSLVSNCHQNSGVWLGFTESEKDLTTVFDLSSEWTGNKWFKKEPNSSEENCIKIVNGRIHDVNCDGSDAVAASSAIFCERHNLVEYCSPEKRVFNVTLFLLVNIDAIYNRYVPCM